VSTSWTNHLIWAAGLAGHLLVLWVLFRRRRAARFPWFTLLIVFYLMRSLGLVVAARISGHAAPAPVTVLIDMVDVGLQCGVLAELSWIALRPLGGIRRLTLPLLLVVSAFLIVLRLAPSGHSSLPLILVLMHFWLSVLMVEWALVLVVMARSLRITWRSHGAVISFGFGVYSAALLAGGGYFTTGREMRDFVFFSLFRVVVYLLVLGWWSFGLWPEDGRNSVAG
jgi:hypothetical protein